MVQENPPQSVSKKKQGRPRNMAELQRAVGGEAPPRAPANLKKIFTRLGLVLFALWIAAIFTPTWIPKAIVGALTVVAIGGGVWIVRYVKKSEALGALIRSADTAVGRKEAIERLEKDFKKGDTQAVLARAQLEMQEDPRKALLTLEAVNLDKQLQPVADQVRTLRAMLHLTLGQTAEARALADKLDLGKAQDATTRAMFATVAGEAWARSGNGKKAVETLELFNPDDPEFNESRVQMWRARAFAYAAVNDTKGISRALKKLADTSPQLLAMFVGAKKIHPLLEREAKQMLMRMGAVPRKVVRQRM